MFEMVSHQLLSDRTQSFVHRGDLGQDVSAIPVLIDHLLQATHLPFDSPQSLKVARLRIGIDACRVTLPFTYTLAPLHAATLAVYPASSTARTMSLVE